IAEDLLPAPSLTHSNLLWVLRRRLCSDGRLSYECSTHIAGGFAGMSIGYTVFSCFDKALLKDPRFWIAIAAYLACVLFAVFFSIFLSPAN
ncbi:hypothetical protein E2I00_004925, partial [Balaenoptera physalus]